MGLLQESHVIRRAALAGAASFAAGTLSCAPPSEFSHTSSERPVSSAFSEIDIQMHEMQRNPVSVKQTKPVIDTHGNLSALVTMTSDGMIYKAALGKKSLRFEQFKPIVSPMPFPLKDPSIFEITQKGSILVGGGDAENRNLTSLFLWNTEQSVWKPVSFEKPTKLTQIQPIGDTGKYLLTGEALGAGTSFYVVSRVDGPFGPHVVEVLQKKKLSHAEARVIAIDSAKAHAKIIVTSPNIRGIEVKTVDYQIGDVIQDEAKERDLLSGNSHLVYYRIGGNTHAVMNNGVGKALYDIDVDYASSQQRQYRYETLRRSAATVKQLVDISDVMYHANRIVFGGRFIDNFQKPVAGIGSFPIGSDSLGPSVDVCILPVNGAIAAGGIQFARLHGKEFVIVGLQRFGNILIPLNPDGTVDSAAPLLFPNKGLVK